MLLIWYLARWRCAICAVPPERNPALTLGALLAVSALEGHDKLLLLSTKSLQGYTYRIGQLVGASTCKAAKD